jgi:DNA-binding MarR family transcriptional regulator
MARIIMSNKSISAQFVIKNALLASKLSKRVGNHLSIHGISLSEYLVMHHLEHSPNKAVARIELAEHIGMSASGVTRLIAPMEKNGIIEKVANPRDARQSLVKLSAAGQRLYADARTSFEQITDEQTASVSQAQQEKILELYAKLI